MQCSSRSAAEKRCTSNCDGTWAKCSASRRSRKRIGSKGASAAGRRTHDDRDSAEVCGVASGGVPQGQERDSLGASVRGEEEELCGSAFLGTRVFRVHGG